MGEIGEIVSMWDMWRGANPYIGARSLSTGAGAAAGACLTSTCAGGKQPAGLMQHLEEVQRRGGPREGRRQWSGRFLGIIGWDPSVCKSNRLHVHIFRFSFYQIRVHSLKSSEVIGGNFPAVLDLNRLSLRNKRLKFKTSGKLPISLEEFIEYIPNLMKENRNWLDLQTLRSQPAMPKICPITCVCTSNSTIKHVQNPNRKSELPCFSYGYWKCVFWLLISCIFCDYWYFEDVVQSL